MDNARQNPTNEVSTSDHDYAQMNVDETKEIIRGKGSWFFWIAGLSVINAFVATKGMFFIAGLAIAQIVDGIVVEITGDINLFISLITPAIFVIFGYFAYNLKRWAFIVGSLVYILDGLIYLYFSEWLAAGFHVFVLYNLFKGYKEITEYERQLAHLKEAG